MDMEKIYRKALALDFLTADEALVLYESGTLDELMRSDPEESYQQEQETKMEGMAW